MVGDLFHYGHMRFLKQVRKHAQKKFPNNEIQIVVGITADKYLLDYKRQPCTSNKERTETVEGCKFVDQVIPSVPLITTDAFMKQYNLDCIFHGDDYTIEQVTKYYGEIYSRGMFFSVPYSSDAVSTTSLLRTAAARQAMHLSKLATARRDENHTVSPDDVTGFTFRSYEGPVIDKSECDRIMELLHLYGTHFKNVFGPDMIWRLFQGNRNGQSGLEGWSAWCVAPSKIVNESKTSDNDMLRITCVSHCCCIYNDEIKDMNSVDVGLFGQVITDPMYRRRGLSTNLVSKVLKDWDDRHPNGWLILGTVSGKL
jgi:cytidyltransferase-like protein